MKNIFLVKFSGYISRNIFLKSIASHKIFRPYFQKIDTRILFFVYILLFELLFWTFQVQFCSSFAPFDSQEQEDKKSRPERSRQVEKDMKNIFAILTPSVLQLLSRPPSSNSSRTSLMLLLESKIKKQNFYFVEERENKNILGKISQLWQAK